MSWRRVRRLLLITLLGFLAVKAIRSLRGPEAPAFTRHPSAWDGQATTPDPAVAARPATASTAAPAASSPPVPAPEPAPAPEPVTPPVAEPAPPSPAASAETTWVRPVDGSCPQGFPIKAKERSGIYHEPGMFAYERTNPDRCYPTAADAQADGFRAAKR